MKVVSVTGCTCDSLTIDGVESIDMKVEDVQAVIKRVIDQETDMGILQSILVDLVSHMGEFEDLGYCEECSDHIEQYTFEVE